MWFLHRDSYLPQINQSAGARPCPGHAPLSFRPNSGVWKEYVNFRKRALRISCAFRRFFHGFPCSSCQHYIDRARIPNPEVCFLTEREWTKWPRQATVLYYGRYPIPQQSNGDFSDGSFECWRSGDCRCDEGFFLGCTKSLFEVSVYQKIITSSSLDRTFSSESSTRPSIMEIVNYTVISVSRNISTMSSPWYPFISLLLNDENLKMKLSIHDDRYRWESIAMIILRWI
jgi:hypothetical protein